MSDASWTTRSTSTRRRLRAGLPAATKRDDSGRVTTGPALSAAPSPKITAPETITLPLVQAWRPTVTGLATVIGGNVDSRCDLAGTLRSSGRVGWEKLKNMVRGPTMDRSPMATGAQSSNRAPAFTSTQTPSLT